MANQDLKSSRRSINAVPKEKAQRPALLIARFGAFFGSFSRGTFSSPPPGKARRVASFLIIAYLLWQLTLPLLYYFRDDKSDERFSWRMFSAVYFQQNTCALSLAAWRPGADLVPLSQKEFKEAISSDWREFLTRDYAPVVNKFLHRYCQSHPEFAEVQLIRICNSAAGAGKIMNRSGLICRTGEFIRARDS